MYSHPMGKVRPQVMAAIGILGIIAVIGVFNNMNEITGVYSAGIIALAKDVISVDAG